MTKKLKNFCFLAGGTDLVVQLKENKLPQIKNIVDLSALTQLRGIKEDKKNAYIGALTKISDIQNSDIIKKYFPALAAAACCLGSKQIRNLATIGGNLVNASPIGDTLPSLFVYGAKIVTTNGKNKKIIPIEKFITGYRKTVLKQGEIVKEIILPKTMNYFSFFKKAGQRKAVVMSKASIALNGLKISGKIKDIKIAAGSVGPRVLRAKKTENFLRGKILQNETIINAVNILAREITPITDVRSTAEYRTHISGEFLKEALCEFAKH